MPSQLNAISAIARLSGGPIRSKKLFVQRDFEHRDPHQPPQGAQAWGNWQWPWGVVTMMTMMTMMTDVYDRCVYSVYICIYIYVYIHLYTMICSTLSLWHDFPRRMTSISAIGTRIYRQVLQHSPTSRHPVAAGLMGWWLWHWVDLTFSIFFQLY